MADLFISYSRKDKDFVRQLHDALAQQNRDIWVDWEDIPITADWLKEIYAGIDGANAFVFVISPDSIASNTCTLEINHAVEQHKRLLPILRREVNPKDAPEAISKINWLYFRETDDFDKTFKALLAALETDLDWVRAHTRLLTRAIEWDNQKRDSSFLLQGKDLREAEEWLAQAVTGKEPKPTSLQSEYILASRRASLTRQRMTLGAVSFGLVVAIVLAVIALFQRNEAVTESNVRATAESVAVAESNNRATAEANAIAAANARATAQAEAVTQAKISRSRELAALAINQTNTDPELSTLLALEASSAWDTAQAEDALRFAVGNSAVRTLRGHNVGVELASFSPDGKSIYSLDVNGIARVWDTATGAPVREIKSPSAIMQISPNGEQAIANRESRDYAVIDLTTGKINSILPGLTAHVYHPQFTPDGRLIVGTVGTNIARVWEASTGRVVSELRGHSDEIVDIRLSWDGGMVGTASRDHTVKIWETLTGKEVREFATNGAALGFSPDGKSVVSVSPNSTTTATVWDLTTGSSRATLSGHTGDIYDAEFSPDGEIIVTASSFPDDSVRVWDAQTGRQLALLSGHTSWVNTAAVSPDNSLIVSASDDDTVRVWRVPAGKPAITLHGQENGIYNAHFSPDTKTVLAAAWNGGVRAWDGVGGKSRFELRGDESIQFGAAFSPDAALIGLVSAGNVVRIYDGRTGTAVAELLGHTGNVNEVAFSADNKLVITASEDHTARVWNAQTGILITELIGHGVGVYHALLSPNGQFALTAADNTRIWDANTGKLITTLPHAYKTAAFSPDNTRVAMDGPGLSASIYEVKTGRRLVELIGHTASVEDLAFSQDGRFLATASDDYTARVWEVASGKLTADLIGHTDMLNAIAFSPDGKFLATAGDDRTARVWQANTGRQLLVLRGHTGVVSSVEFSADGRFIVTGSGDGAARIYSCEICGSLEELISIARGRVTRDFTCEERVTYLNENLNCSSANLIPTAAPTAAR